jgi:hypothetical protein
MIRFSNDAFPNFNIQTLPQHDVFSHVICYMRHIFSSRHNFHVIANPELECTSKFKERAAENVLNLRQYDCKSYATVEPKIFLCDSLYHTEPSSVPYKK